MRLVKLKEIRDLGKRIYTKEGFIEFLNTPLPVFDGKTALDLITIGDYDKVIGALAADLEKLPADPLNFLPKAKPDGMFQVTP